MKFHWPNFSLSHTTKISPTDFLIQLNDEIIYMKISHTGVQYNQNFSVVTAVLVIPYPIVINCS